MNTEVMFSSKTDNWSTPQSLFDELDREFHFCLDVCADSSNTKCEYFITEEEDGLVSDWHEKFSLPGLDWKVVGTVFCNPPYSQSKLWIKKAVSEAKNGVTTVMLLPARTDTIAFHQYIYKQPNVEIRFLKGRLKFGNSINSAPFPSMIVIFRPNK